VTTRVEITVEVTVSSSHYGRWFQMGKCRKEAEGSWNIRQLKITTHHSDCSSEVAGPKSSFFESSATKKFTVVYCIIDDSTLGRIRFCALILYFVKKKDFSHISEKYSLFLANNIVIAINYWNFSYKIVVFVKIKNKRTKPDTSLNGILVQYARNLVK